jgi:hypothetical protein
LRRGFYQIQGKTDEILILPNTAFDSKADGFMQRHGSYGISAWAGSVRNNKLLFVSTGTVSGNEICFTVDGVNAGISYETAGELTIAAGTQITYTIVSYESFMDADGQKWIYHRDSRGF